MPEDEALGYSHDGVHLDQPHPLGSRLTPTALRLQRNRSLLHCLHPNKQSVRKETAMLTHWIKQSLLHCDIDTSRKLSHPKTAFFLLSRGLFASCFFPQIRKDGQPHASEIRRNHGTCLLGHLSPKPPTPLEWMASPTPPQS